MTTFDVHVRRALDSLPPDLAAKLENVAVVIEDENPEEPDLFGLFEQPEYLPARIAVYRRPLQEELFGGHMGGETFFQNLHTLLARQDTDDLADLLEVHQLCLLLGFEGRYGAGGRDELRAWRTAVADKITRVRGRPGALSPAWAPPNDEVIPIPRDAWIRPLAYGAIAMVALSSLGALLFWIWQQSWIADLKGALR